MGAQAILAQATAFLSFIHLSPFIHSSLPRLHLAHLPAMAQPRAPLTLRKGDYIIHCINREALEVAVEVFKSIEVQRPEDRYMPEQCRKYEELKKGCDLAEVKRDLRRVGRSDFANHINKSTTARHFLAHPRPDRDQEVLRHIAQLNCATEDVDLAPKAYEQHDK